MARVSYGSRTGRVGATTTKASGKNTKSPAEVVREIKKQSLKTSNDDYRERALALHGLVCVRCTREFDDAHRQLLTIHHKDGNHYNNPPDGSNWEPLCVYCHEDTHSREMLGDYLNGAGGGRESSLVYQDKTQTVGSTLAEKLKKALAEKTKFNP